MAKVTFVIEDGIVPTTGAEGILFTVDTELTEEERGGQPTQTMWLTNTLVSLMQTGAVNHLIAQFRAHVEASLQQVPDESSPSTDERSA